ncbi:MAG: helix-turn-helix domain-containing protein [Sulfurimonas sp.]|nr:helix-turn-helix domain-containing protein [Sulfurimonas sp.]
MNQVDRAIYKAFLTILRGGTHLNVTNVSRLSGVSRRTLYNKLDKYTYQDLTKNKEVQNG